MRPRPPAAAPNPGRERLLEEITRSGVSDAAVLAAMAKVPRDFFLDDALKNRAYENNALPIGHAQTISQPAIVAFMSQALTQGRKLARVLEIGTGSGYQTAVLAELVDTVFTVERIKALSEQARQRLSALGYRNVHFGYADGMKGWLPYAPYDGILVTAGAENVPQALLDQLGPNGRLVIPVGPQGRQSLRLIERRGGILREQDLGWVSFVPLLAGKV
ncbi:protein-L-isoaspartate(D-aspartate) O-methyltransferase [Solimonas aquatica]|uniref:Protein-L-isoaspartate O-methyltransferase n=1 Tax=Solimonas aquatica TaxID=489703 RepID=A0A1H9AIB9_9GAMM|nr:protein-L-isoaspartate(D-aspartate) O-methyltransferase [Solimonas aquatica]SEP76237.1 protein-L-isoaspartate(D-aspartate) O-methyltransferase [Solimonas aquatica]